MASKLVSSLSWLSAVVLLLVPQPPLLPPQGGHQPLLLRPSELRLHCEDPHGSFKALHAFSGRTQLRGGATDSYRLGLLRAAPAPSSSPATGTPTSSSTSSKRGDVLWVPAGTMVYLLNADAKESLRVAVLLRTISSPTGDYMEFFAAGGLEPESFLRAFSSELQEAAFNSRRRSWKRILGRQQKGAFVKVTEEQIRALLSHREGGQSGTRSPFPLLSQKPSYSNDRGQMHEVTAREYPQLRRLDVVVSLANITAGSMEAPSYNSKATRIALVISGEATSRWHGGAAAGSSGRGRREVFVIPAGQPVVTVAASGGEGLQVLCFGLQAEENRRIFLAGENGVLKELEREAKELSFGAPRKEVDEVLNAQKRSIFVEGPQQASRRGAEPRLS
ncbi:unnamed protein product [Spirodela intermedia]|uniref:Cupin type-1 domain-containing protein n=1 Tax=Spirodela intermedia TaxID=51605 RepID=A0A7I8IKX3_SPIIN|nr:unnamed protein product [Spirodela intermedia]CAA6658533.1 unnamed protein product [Spirodela intermedia]